jgi:hypothetical protein|tara:strand:+ start:821 stop:1312 length:492 start_codon:yes stop_codon:yes gene_type:complete
MQSTIFPLLKSDAVFSPDRLYRYGLWRIWDDTLPTVLFIGLNPSTADEFKNDPTIRRCIGYAKDWGYGGYIMGNIFGFRATDPNTMKAVKEPIGAENNKWLLRLHDEADLTIGAWGNHGGFMNRGKEVVTLIPNLKCLKITNQGYPSHPLYLKKILKPIPFSI